MRFNTEDYPGDVGLVWTPEGRRQFAIRGKELELGDVTAVWYRRPVPPNPELWPSPDRGRWAAAESREALEGVWRSIDTLWVNHPDCNRLASSKLQQLQHAEAIGFDVPATLVTNDREAVRTFAKNRGSLVCKPLAEGRLQLDEGDRLFFTSQFELSADDLLEEFGLSLTSSRS